jgi:hypothetical protein
LPESIIFGPLACGPGLTKARSGVHTLRVLRITPALRRFMVSYTLIYYQGCSLALEILRIRGRHVTVRYDDSDNVSRSKHKLTWRCSRISVIESYSEFGQRCALIMTALLFFCLPVRTVRYIYTRRLISLVTVHGGLRPSMAISDVEVSDSSLPETRSL